MRGRSMRSGKELAREIKLTDWSMARNLSSRSSGVQILRDICTHLKRYLYSAKCSWIIIGHICILGIGLELACKGGSCWATRHLPKILGLVPVSIPILQSGKTYCAAFCASPVVLLEGSGYNASCNGLQCLENSSGLQ